MTQTNRGTARVVSTAEANDIYKDISFVDVSRYGPHMAIMNYEVGRLRGDRILVDTPIKPALKWICEDCGSGLGDSSKTVYFEEIANYTLFFCSEKCRVAFDKSSRKIALLL